METMILGDMEVCIMADHFKAGMAGASSDIRSMIYGKVLDLETPWLSEDKLGEERKAELKAAYAKLEKNGQSRQHRV